MQQSNRTHLLVGLLSGFGAAASAALLMGQGASQPVKSETQYFVTADGEGAHLWVREGVNLRVVGHGACAECTAEGHDDHGHEEGDGHDHGSPAPKK